MTDANAWQGREAVPIRWKYVAGTFALICVIQAVATAVIIALPGEAARIDRLTLFVIGYLVAVRHHTPLNRLPQPVEAQRQSAAEGKGGSLNHHLEVDHG